jgi:hypothetical protein
MATSPFGGLVVAIPFGIFVLHYPPWLAMLAGVPFAYIQVIVVDGAWTLLTRLPWWAEFLERKRSRTIERVLASRGGFWATFLASPVVGPWVVMGFLRYARISQRRVVLPIFLSLGCVSAVVTALCVFAPHLLPHR